MKTDCEKLSVYLSVQVLDCVREMAAAESVSVTEILRRAIGAQKFIEETQKSGRAIYVRDFENKQFERVIFQ
ncbi:ribbon-helix-helix protein, CopG family [Arthrobacter sp. JCM 19049]|uniref:ribbon-helix-helix protein, CopG family n=1 Tax=Arthrobacter sp. JCM 19049 TaxID=1460643 RepID=UPI0006D04896